MFIISNIFTSSNVDFKHSGLLNHILDNCKIYSREILTGMLCGFVIGAKGISNNRNLTDDEETVFRSIFLSSNAGIGYVIGCVGGVILNDFFLGLALYVIQILTALLLFKIVKTKKATTQVVPYSPLNQASFYRVITNAVMSTTSTLIIVAGFNIFFSSVADLLFINLGITSNSFAYHFINSLFDFSRACYFSSTLTNKAIQFFIIGLSVGFGGLSVHFQIFTQCEGYPLKAVKFTLLKLAQGVLCGILFSFLLFLY